MTFAFTAIHISGRGATARVQGWITVLKLGLLGLLMIAGLIAGSPHAANIADRPPMAEWPVLAMLGSLVYISYAYTGWNAASYMAGEFVEPQRKLPRAILLGTLGVVVLYLGLNVVYALALPAAEIRQIAETKGVGSVAVIADLAARRLFGQRWSSPLSVAIGLMLLSSLSAYVLTGPRVIYAMAVAGQFPSVAARLTARARTPAVASVLQTSFTLVFIWASTLKSLVEYAGIGLSISAMLAVSSVYILRWKRPDLPRPFRTPGYPLTPLVFLIPTAMLTGAAFSQKKEASTYALLSILAGVPVYFLTVRRGRRKPAATAGGA
jgi:APA family basic amino acid/polyamine antiporter